MLFLKPSIDTKFWLEPRVLVRNAGEIQEHYETEFSLAYTNVRHTKDNGRIGHHTAHGISWDLFSWKGSLASSRRANVHTAFERR